MATVAPPPSIAAGPIPDPAKLLAYIEEMLLELAELAAAAGEAGLAASLAIATIQASAARERRSSTRRPAEGAPLRSS